MVKSYTTLNLKKNLKQRIITKLLQSRVKLLSSTKNPKTSKKTKSLSIKETPEINTRESIKEHYFTFQLYNDLFTLLYATLIFKWIQTDRVLIVIDNTKLGYQIELFLKFFRMNSVFLDSQMPVNTNRHNFNQFIKGVFSICIVLNKYNANSPNFAAEVIEQTPIPATIINFNLIDPQLLESQCFHQNVKAIYHFNSKEKKELFTRDYANIDTRIEFQEFIFNTDQMHHLRYRCEDIFHSIRDSDIKKLKAKKINQELLYSKNMQEYFQAHPDDKAKVVKAIEENSIRCIKPSASFLPNYLIHEDTKNNQIAQAIKTNYGSQKISKYKRRSVKGKMEKYLDGLEKADGSHENVKF